ncbi:Pheophytinase, chloroplastic [Quillaja saponaria]|uniref:Pheophytinase, chloroplastic n=1 Tax=Quillaja saponaria TaxID=32244 RepID=A0AAD7L1F1_QUISA|nr:Pheophytinase, chloroplastic [Quillaja saponaria]
MALLTFPHFPSLSLFPNTRFISQTRRRLSSFGVKMTLSSNRDKSGAAILWFKHDLRIDDHPGLVAASKYKDVVPIYVFDPRILSRLSDEMLEMILFAVEDLRKSLKDCGSDLMIRFGNAENVIQELVKEVKATCVFAEKEVEYDLCLMMDIVKKKLEALTSSEESTKIILWHTPFYDIKLLKEIPTSYNDFKKLQCPITVPLLHTSLAGVEMELDWGSLPTYDDLQIFMSKNPKKLEANWISIKATSAETLSQEQLFKSSKSYEKNIISSQRKSSKLGGSVFVTKRRNMVGGGTNSVLNALAAYLRYLEGTARDDWQEVHERTRSAESRDGASFIRLFGPALCLGIISRRRVHYEAIKYEKERNGGFLSPFGYSAATIAAAVDAVSSMEWYWLMALRDQRNDDRKHYIRIWRWNGYLVQYTADGTQGPAVLLVHGFGAFWEHFRGNIRSIVEGGNRVWAITVLGFGKSEKPNLVYTELLWAELLRDFIIEVVGEPVHLVGNSIGGYFVAIVGHLWSSLAKSIVLVNSAGNIIPSYTSVPFTKERQTSGFLRLGAQLLLLYLRLRIKDIVKKYYPSRAERVDDWLINEMLRASYDPGVPVVLESIFSFNLSIPLNYLLEDFKENVLIIQGMKDPISDSQSKVAMIKEHCPGFVIRELDAGHCPHDEVPEEVNPIIREWILNVERKRLVECPA